MEKLSKAEIPLNLKKKLGKQFLLGENAYYKLDLFIENLYDILLYLYENMKYTSDDLIYLEFHKLFVCLNNCN